MSLSTCISARRWFGQYVLVWFRGKLSLMIFINHTSPFFNTFFHPYMGCDTGSKLTLYEFHRFWSGHRQLSFSFIFSFPLFSQSFTPVFISKPDDMVYLRKIANHYLYPLNNPTTLGRNEDQPVPPLAPSGYWRKKEKNVASVIFLLPADGDSH